jgi:hypothetical protein
MAKYGMHMWQGNGFFSAESLPGRPSSKQKDGSHGDNCDLGSD